MSKISYYRKISIRINISFSRGVGMKGIKNNNYAHDSKQLKALLPLCSLILSMSFVQITKADSTQAGPIGSKPMQQQPTTTVQQKPVIIDPAYPGKLRCDPGYVLTDIDTNAQDKVNISVCSECNGVSIVGYAHVWCLNNCSNYKAVKSAPVTQYICKKIENQWQPAS
jgi:hypothetical protein